MSQEVKVGVGVAIMRGRYILLGKRKGAHGEGTYAPPGGRLKFMESFEQCAIRETAEETGIKLHDNFTLIGCSNNMFPEENHHYLSVLLLCHMYDGEPQTLEPDKCEGWGWYDLGKLPEPLFPPFKDLVDRWLNPPRRVF